MQNVATEDITGGAWGATAHEWAFELGQCATHIDQSMPSLVLSRQRTGSGVEIYGVRSFALVDLMRDRMVLGEVLVSIDRGSEPCDDCLLYNTCLCRLAA